MKSGFRVAPWRLGCSLGLALLLLSSPSLAALVIFDYPATQSGTFVTDDQVDHFQFSLSETRSVRFRSQSFSGGVNAQGQNVPATGFDPIVTLFDSSGDLIAEADDNEDDFFDFDLTLELDAGVYTVAISQFDNFAAGLTQADGFDRAGEGNFTVAEFCESPSTGPFCDVDGIERSGFYSFDITIGSPTGGNVDIEIVLVGFEDLGTQTDLIGIFDPGIQETVFRVFDDQQGVVATAAGELASFASIVQEDFFNRVLSVGSSAGTPVGPRGSVVIADVPGIGATAGPLAEFFATPRDLRGGDVSLLVRDSSSALFALGPAGMTSVQSVLMDADGNEMATDPMPLTSDFQNLAFDVDTGYTRPVGGAFQVDYSRIAGVRFEFFDSAAVAGSHSFDLDDVQVAPELSAAMAHGTIVGLLSLGSLLRGTRLRLRHKRRLRNPIC